MEQNPSDRTKAYSRQGNQAISWRVKKLDDGRQISTLTVASVSASGLPLRDQSIDPQKFHESAAECAKSGSHMPVH